MPFDLWLAAAECDEHREREKLTGRNVQAGSGVVVAEAIGGQVALEVDFVLGRRGIHPVDDGIADDFLLKREPGLFARLGCAG